MYTPQVYDWLADKPVKPEYRARVASLVSTYIGWEKITIEQAYNYWLGKRVDFFEADAAPLVVDASGTGENGGQARIRKSASLNTGSETASA